MDYAKKMAWTGGLILLLFIVATFAVAFGMDNVGLVWAMLGLNVLPAAAIVSWALYWYHKHAHFVYEVLGTTITFDSPDYYVPSSLMLRLVRSVHKAWKPHLDVDPKEVYSRVSLTIMKNRPIDPAGRTDKVVGLTYHRLHHSQVWGPYALDPGGAGYELLLHGAEYKWPGSDEGDKIARMKELGVFDALREAYKLEFNE
jgi:hypothetical protein